MALSILIQTERLFLKRPRSADLDFITRIFCDEGIMRYLGKAWDRQQAEDSLLEWRDNWGKENNWYGVMVKKEGGARVGMAGFSSNTIPDEPGLELSWFVLPVYQGQGFASEITRALLDFAFTRAGAELVLAETHPDNPASNRVLEKLGFACLGKREHTYDFLPDFTTQVLWAMPKLQWDEIRLINGKPLDIKLNDE
jgi:RimJ/RimL family protein N-acetyltransferase